MSSSRRQRYFARTKRKNLLNKYERIIQRFPSIDRKLDYLNKIKAYDDSVIKLFIYNKKIQLLNQKAEINYIRKLKQLIKKHSDEPMDLLMKHIKHFAWNVNKSFKRFHHLVKENLKQLEDVREHNFIHAILTFFKFAYDEHIQPIEIIKAGLAFINTFPKSDKVYNVVMEELMFRFGDGIIIN